MHDFRFPGESAEYRAARDELLRAEIDLRRATERANLVFVAKSPPKIRALAADRGWSALRFLSSARNTYNRDYYGETADGAQMPMLNVFVRDGGEVRHFWGTELLHAPPDEGQDQRHVDAIWPIWALIDMTPEGRPDGYGWPALDYG